MMIWYWIKQLVHSQHLFRTFNGIAEGSVHGPNVFIVFMLDTLTEYADDCTFSFSLSNDIND